MPLLLTLMKTFSDSPNEQENQQPTLAVKASLGVVAFSDIPCAKPK